MNSLEPKSNLSRKCVIAIVLSSISFFTLCTLLAFTRNIDGDEGLYLEAARLVAEGKRLYVDFFFQQMPLLPYLYALWMKLFGFTIYSARMFSVVLASLTFLGTVLYVARRSHKPVIIYLIALFLFNGVLLAWAPVIKTHSFNLFCLTLSTLLILEWRNSASRSTRYLLFAGFLLGIGVSGRLLLAPFFVVQLFYIFWDAKGERFKQAFSYLFVFLIACFPIFYYGFLDFARFSQDNFIFHAQVYPGFSDLSQRIWVAGEIFLKPHFLILLILALIGIFLKAKREGKRFFYSDEAFIFLTILAFVFVHLSTAWAFTQYFSAMVPLLCLCLIPFFQAMLQRFPESAYRILSIPILFYLLFAYPQLSHEIRLMYSDGPEWSLKNIKRATSVFQKKIPSGETCLTWWPGYAFMVGCRSVLGMENHMRNHALEEGATGEILKPYKLLSDESLIQGLENRSYPYIIDGVYRRNPPSREKIEILIAEKYQLLEEIAGIKLYRVKNR